MILIYMLIVIFQPQIGLKITRKIVEISTIVGISLIILKNFEDLELELFLREKRHLPR